MFRFLQWLKVAYKLPLVDLLIMDCDGTMTDGKMAGEYKFFSSKDGMGIVLLNQLISLGIISGDSSIEINKRAVKLALKYCYTGEKDKAKIIRHLKKYYKYIAYVGDDINDIEAMKECYVSFAVGDAEKEVKKVADYTTKGNGGNGAVREVCDMIRRAKRGKRIGV